MTKRLICVLIVLAMVASFVPAISLGVSAEGAAKALPGPDALKNHTDHTGWIKWTDATKMPTAAGNYYLDVDVNLSGAAWSANGDIKLCLNGHHVKQTTANQRVIDVYGTLTVFDCTASYDAAGNYQSGTITGGSRTYGAGISVKNDAVLNLYGGAITGNANTASEGFGGGVYLAQNKSNTQAGGVFNMYGGEVSGNTAQYGGGVYVPGHNTSSTYTSKAAAVNIYGGKLRNNIATQNGGAICQRFKPSTVAVTIENAEISGNQAQSTASGKGCGGAIYMEVGGALTIKNTVIKENISSNGAIYAQGGAPVKLENVQVIDNEANTTGTSGIYIAGSSSTLTVSGLVVVDGNENNNIYFNNASSKPLYVNELASGSKLQYNTNSKVNTDDKVATVITLASGGKQTGWENISIVCNGEEVNYTSSGFKFGHYHGDQKYTAWESGSTLPSNGYNFLTQDVLRTKEANMAGDSHICLNGYDITVSPDATDTLRMMAIPGKVTIEDCSAHYDENGKYISGALTGGNRTYGAAVAVRQGGVFTLESGAIRGNANSDEGGAVYINGNSATKNGGKFIMNGGEITGNSTQRGAIAIAAGVAGSTTPGTFVMNGGKIYGNTGDGIYTWASTDVQLLGGTVEDRVYTRCDLTIGEAELKDVYLVGNTIFKVANAKGAKVSFSAEKGGRYVSDVLTDTTSTFTYQKDDFKLTTQDSKLYLAPAHEHCVEGETGCGHSQLGWNAWTDKTKLPESGNYYLETDVELTKTAELKGLNLCLNGHTVKNVAENTRVLNVASGTVTLTDCAKEAGTVTGGNRDYGAGITVSNGATLNIYNIKISGNENKADGGALYIRGGGTVNMFSGEISGNKSRTGAAVCIADKAANPGVFNLYGGTITGNTATGNGGALFGYVGAQFNLSGGTITGNTATHGGAFCFGATMDKITVSGNVQITGNSTHAGKNDDMYLTAGKIITVGDLNGAKIGVMNDGSYAQITDKEATGFESNRSSRVVVAKDGALWLDDTKDHTHCLCDGALGGCDHSDVKWMSWDESDSLPASGSYYLTCDVTLAATFELQQELQLCLNGYTVRSGWQEGQDKLRLMGVAAGKTLSITDCQGTGLLTGGNRDYGSAISVREKAVLNLYGGTISGNTNGADGTVYIARGTFNMYGGEISGNVSAAGGAVCLAETKEGISSAANLYGGIITGNEAKRGGGVYVYDGGILNLSGTKVDGNKASLYGGGVYLKPGVTFTMTDGSVDKNVAAEFAGGVYAGRGESYLSGGSISGNRGGKDGGGMYCVAGFVTLSGTTVSGNTSGGAGGGICLVQNVVGGTELRKGSFTMTGGLLTGNESKNSGGGAYVRVADAQVTGGKVTGNKANGNGGGFYFAGVEVTLQNVEITNNTSVNDSGAVGAGQNQFTLNGEKVSVQAKVTIGDGAKLNNNKAKNGGAMSIYHSTQLILEGGQVNNNYASNMGGGIIVGKPGIFQMTGGSVSGNRAEKSSGGGLYVAGSASVQIKGGNITNNWCKKYGAGVYVNKCTVNIYGGYIGGNYSDESGSGISSSASGIVNLYGGTIANNTAKSSAGGILIQSKSVLNMYGGTVSGNKVPSGGAGIYISNNSFINMSGGKVIGNVADRYGSGLYTSKATIKITGGTFEDNYSEKGGTVYLTGSSNAELSNLTVRGNKANNSGGGVVFSRSTGFLKDSLIEENEATAGAALLVQMEAVVNEDSKVVCENVTMRNNKATTLSGGAVYIFRQVDVTMRGCELTGNTAAEDGGAIYMNCGQSLLDYRSYLTLENCKVEGNTAGQQGGAAFVNNMMYLNLENSKVLNNTAAQEGGGIYGAKGSHLTVTDSLISGNEAGKTGAAVYGGYDVNLLGGTITDNKTAEGAAVYLAPGMFDGHSYTNGKVKLAGNLIIKDNDCPQADLYIDEGRVCGTTAEGFGEDTEIHVLLHSGLITRTIIAAYDYEGGDCKYIVTYGDRSMTEIEPGAEQYLAKPIGQAQTQEEAKSGGDVLLYAGIGVVAVAAIAGIVLVILKKKKSPAGEAK